MRSSWRSGRRRLAVVIGSLLAAAVFVASAPAEHGVLELVSTGPAGGNGAFSAFFAGASADGARVFLETQEPLVSADTDTALDVYERAGGQTTLLSTGPAGGNGDFLAVFRRASADGARVFFETAEPLVSGDTDAAFDVYERAGGETTLLSTGPAGGNGDFGAVFRGASADGLRVFFDAGEPLVSGDTDAAFDVYERAGGETTLLSTGPAGGNGDFNAFFFGASADGLRVFFRTTEPLVSADTDAQLDVYERAGGQTTLLSTGPAGGNGAFGASFQGASADGLRVFFATNERLVSADTDTTLDVYERAGGATTLLSTGPAGGNGSFGAFFQGASADGLRVFFVTAESLVSADTDTSQDVYERAGGQTTLLSTGPLGGNGDLFAVFVGTSVDGARVFFATAEPLVSADTDTALDVYERAGGQTTLLSTGPAGGNGDSIAVLRGASADGARVFFETDEPLVSADTDAAVDVYERAGGQTTLLSTGPAGGNGAVDAFFAGASADGLRVFFETAESLVSADSDTAFEVYVKRIAAPESTAAPAISGTAVAGQTLGCSQGLWTNNPSSFAYRWNRDGAAIPGATSSTYTLTDADVARQITCTVTASNAAGAGSATSAPVTPTAPPPPPPPPPPAPRLPAPRPAPAVLRLQAPSLSVFGRSGSEARCRMRTGRIRSCTVRLLLGQRVLAQGRAGSRRAGRRSLTVTLRLTGFGRTLLADRLGGVGTRVRAVGATSGGARRATVRTRAILQVERFTTPPGSFEPDQVELSPRGLRFLRSLRGKLIAVASLRCDGYSADTNGTAVATGPISLARAEAMCRALRRLGVRAQPRLAGHGDTAPIASNASESGWAENRRVEVTVTHRPRRL